MFFDDSEICCLRWCLCSDFLPWLSLIVSHSSVQRWEVKSGIDPIDRPLSTSGSSVHVPCRHSLANHHAGNYKGLRGNFGLSFHSLNTFKMFVFIERRFFSVVSHDVISKMKTFHLEVILGMFVLQLRMFFLSAAVRRKQAFLFKPILKEAFWLKCCWNRCTSTVLFGC